MEITRDTITHVKEVKDGYLINRSIFTPFDHRFAAEVDAWAAAGGVIEPEKLLEDYRRDKYNEIRAAFSAEAAKPVVALGIQWHGGDQSGMKLDSARRLSLEGGLTSVEFFDTANVGHVLTLSEAKQVCLAVGQAYQYAFGKKQSLMRQAEAATTKAELDLIAW